MIFIKLKNNLLIVKRLGKSSRNVYYSVLGYGLRYLQASTSLCIPCSRRLQRRNPRLVSTQS